MTKIVEQVSHSDKRHWDKVYKTKAPTEVSWFQEHANLSLELIKESQISHTASIIDVGGGASTLVDDLLEIGYENITVLDISGAALAAARARLGSRADKIQWLEADILNAELTEHCYDLWHDRAVFHFLTAAEERRTYVRKVTRSVRPGGIVVIATFAEDGPTECSGLPVMRFSADELHSEFGPSYTLLRQEKESHTTPGGKPQRYVYCLCRKND